MCQARRHFEALAAPLAVELGKHAAHIVHQHGGCALDVAMNELVGLEHGLEAVGRLGEYALQVAPAFLVGHAQGLAHKAALAAKLLI